MDSRKFEICEKVVCDFDEWRNDNNVPDPVYPEKWKVYAVMGDFFHPFTGEQLLFLSGMPENICYPARHFRRFYDKDYERILYQAGKTFRNHKLGGK